MDDDKSTTDANSDQDSGGNQPLPDDANSQSADNKDQDTEEQDDNQSDSSDESSSSADQNQGEDDLEKFAKSQGFDPENLTDNERKALKLAKDNQSSFHQSREELSALRSQAKDTEVSPEGDDDDLDPLEKEVMQLRDKVNRSERDREITEFYIRNPEAVKYDEKMGEILKGKPHLLGDWEALLVLAKSESLDAAKDAGREEERKALAKKQAAGGVSPNASSSSSYSKTKFTREQIATMSDEEYSKNRPAILEAEQAGLIE